MAAIHGRMAPRGVRVLASPSHMQAELVVGNREMDSYVIPRNGFSASELLAFVVGDVFFLASPCPPPLIEKLSLGYRCTLLHYASYAGNEELVRKLVAEGAPVHSTKHAHRMTPLHLAALNGHECVAHFLLSSGGVPNTSQNQPQPHLSASRSPLT